MKSTLRVGDKLVVKEAAKKKGTVVESWHQLEVIEVRGDFLLRPHVRVRTPHGKTGSDYEGYWLRYWDLVEEDLPI